MTQVQGNAQILAPTPENVDLCAKHLNRGGVVAMPTETVYGLAGIATDPTALTKIFETKERPTFDPLIVHVALEKSTFAHLMREGIVDPEPLSDLAVKRTDQLIRAFWPGPLTLVLPRTDTIPDLVTSGLDTVAVREPAHPTARALIRAVDLPLCAPSANRFGRISPTSAGDVAEELGDRIPFILDGGASEVGLESTILMVEPTGEIRILRPGGLAIERIEDVLGVSLRSAPALLDRESGALAPGMLASHYAPRKPLVLLPRAIREMMSPPHLGVALPKKIGLLAINGKAADQAEILSELLDREVIAETLSENGDWTEAAKNLFRKLRALDRSDAELLLAEPIKETTGLAHAIADRLKRAAGPRS